MNTGGLSRLGMSASESCGTAVLSAGRPSQASTSDARLESIRKASISLMRPRSSIRLAIPSASATVVAPTPAPSAPVVVAEAEIMEVAEAEIEEPEVEEEDEEPEVKSAPDPEKAPDKTVPATRIKRDRPKAKED